MDTPRYYLSPSIHWCVIDRHCIILDVQRDRYLQAPAQDFTSLLPFVLPDSPQSPSLPGRRIPADLIRAAEALLAVDVLTRTPPSSSRQPSRIPARPAELLSDTPGSTSTAQAIRAFPQFVIACARANHHLRSMSFAQISAQVHARKSGHPGSPEEATPEQAFGLTRVFHRLRPLYPRDYLCLFDSLALLEFLAHWRIHPDWVFGVTTDPFMAHCWVQVGSTVLSDSITFCSRWFHPIFAL